MNKLFKSAVSKWNNLFQSVTITPERRALGSTSWTRYHIHIVRFGRKPKYLGYRLHLGAAMAVAANATGGNGTVKIMRGTK